MPRLRGQDKHWIDYRHIIDWLVRKPGAFARYVYREELYPTLTYRRAYDALLAQQPARADKEYVRLLHLASVEGEARVEAALVKLLGQRQPVSEQAVSTLLGTRDGVGGGGDRDRAGGGSACLRRTFARRLRRDWGPG